MKEKLEKLTTILLEHAPLAIAFSGGVDSSFLLAYAQETLGDRCFAVTVSSPAFSSEEAAEANAFCRQIGAVQHIISLDENLLNAIGSNPPDRCYICKKFMFEKVLQLSESLGAARLADGTNADDLLDFRPGLRALAELRILSPLKECGLTKREIRSWLQQNGFQVHAKPAFACLASRIPYGEAITSEKLRRIEALEALLHELGFAQCRVRCHEKLARIEVLPQDRSRFFDLSLIDRVDQRAKELGFTYAALDLQGYRIGSLNPE